MAYILANNKQTAKKGMKKMKFKKTISLIAAAMCFGGISAIGATPVDIAINGKLIEINSNIYIKDGYTMLPARKLTEILGCNEILWNNETKTATFKTKSDELSVQAKSKMAYLNGNKKTMPVPCEIVNDKTYLSARFLCETFDADVSWNDKTHTVYIEKDGINLSDEHLETDYTSHDLEWLAKIVHAEAQGELHDGKVAVANVVINRKESKEFPNNIYDVIFDRKYGVQFTPTISGSIYNDPSKESYKAAKQALFGNNVVGNCLYFLNPKKASSMWIVNNRLFYQSIGNHDFYL